MIKDGYTGRKGRGGFYRMNKEGGKKILEAINLKTGEYAPSKKIDYYSEKFEKYKNSIQIKIIKYAFGNKKDFINGLVVISKCFGWKPKFLVSVQIIW